MSVAWIELVRKTRYLWLVGLSLVLGFAASFVHPVMPIALVIGAVVVGIGVRAPLVLLVVFTLLLYTRIADLYPAVTAMQLPKMVILLALGTTLLSKLLNRDNTWVQTDHNRYIVLLTLAALLSSLLGGNPSESIAFFNENFVKVIVIHFLIINLVDTPARAVRYQIMICSACIFLGLYAGYSAMLGINLVEGTRVTLMGLLEDPNDLAFVMLTGVAFLLVSALEHRGWARVAYAAALLALLSGFMHTQSRGGMLGLLVMSFFIFKNRIRNKLVLLGAMAAVAVAVVVAGGLQERRVGSLSFSEVDESTQGRLDAWKAGLRMFAANPVVGLGFNRFAYNFEAFANSPVKWGTLEAHNSYIKVAAETGVLGLIPFMILIWLSVRNAFRYETLADRLSDPAQRAFLRSLLPNLAGVLTAAFFLSQSWIWYIYIQMSITATLPQCFDLTAQNEVIEEGRM